MIIVNSKKRVIDVTMIQCTLTHDLSSLACPDADGDDGYTLILHNTASTIISAAAVMLAGCPCL